MYLNEVRLIGNLGDAAEIKPMTNGSTLFKMRLATDKEWHSVEFFVDPGKDKQVAFLSQTLTKGALVYVGGSIATDIWTDTKGAQQRWKKIKAWDVKLIHESLKESSMIEAGVPVDFDPDAPEDEGRRERSSFQPEPPRAPPPREPIERVAHDRTPPATTLRERFTRMSGRGS